MPNAAVGNAIIQAKLAAAQMRNQNNPLAQFLSKFAEANKSTQAMDLEREIAKRQAELGEARNATQSRNVSLLENQLNDRQAQTTRSNTLEDQAIGRSLADVAGMAAFQQRGAPQPVQGGPSMTMAGGGFAPPIPIMAPGARGNFTPQTPAGVRDKQTLLDRDQRQAFASQGRFDAKQQQGVENRLKSRGMDIRQGELDKADKADPYVEVRKRLYEEQILKEKAYTKGLASLAGSRDSTITKNRETGIAKAREMAQKAAEADVKLIIGATYDELPPEQVFKLRDERYQLHLKGYMTELEKAFPDPLDALADKMMEGMSPEDLLKFLGEK